MLKRKKKPVTTVRDKSRQLLSCILADVDREKDKAEREERKSRERKVTIVREVIDDYRKESAARFRILPLLSDNRRVAYISFDYQYVCSLVETLVKTHLKMETANRFETWKSLEALNIDAFYLKSSPKEPHVFKKLEKLLSEIMSDEDVVYDTVVIAGLSCLDYIDKREVDTKYMCNYLLSFVETYKPEVKNFKCLFFANVWKIDFEKDDSFLIGSFSNNEGDHFLEGTLSRFLGSQDTFFLSDLKM